MQAVPAAGLPDYDRIAADFDRWPPYTEPVTRALLQKLPALSRGARVVDVACGTGEPGLTLARRSPEVFLLGLDAAAGMVAAARAKAARERLANVRFEVASAEALDEHCPDGSTDALLSRFGLLMFGDVPASARELARVLRPGAAYSMAVWDDMAKNTLVYAVFESLRPRLPAALVPPFDQLSALAAEGRRETLLREAGVATVDSELFGWTMEFSNADTLWQLVSGPGVFAPQFAALPEGASEQVRAEVLAALAVHRSSDGSYSLPHACRLLWGRR